VKTKSPSAANNTAGLQSNHTIELHTELAKKLFSGAWHDDDDRPTWGVPRFAHLVKALMTASTKDDPYADLFLLRIYKDLSYIKTTIDEYIHSHKVYFKVLKSQGVHLTIASSEKVCRKPLKFCTPYAYMAAFLVSDYDYLVRITMTAEQTGVSAITKKRDKKIRKDIGMEIRERVLSRPRQWSKTGVTRRDVIEQTALAGKANHRMGHLPKSILNKSINIPYVLTMIDSSDEDS